MNTVEIGKFIKEHLKTKNYTQDNLAEYLGISKQAVSQNLSGKSSFEISNLMLIAEFLDVTVDELLYAGSKRETGLGKFYNKDLEESDFKDIPKQPDSLNKTLLDYCIEDNNLEKFKLFYNKQLIIESLYNNPKFIAFLIRNNQVSMLQFHFRTPIKDEEGNIVTYQTNQLQFPSLSDNNGQTNGVRVIRTGRRVIPIYANLSSGQREYVDAILECKNIDLLNLIPNLYSNRRSNRGLPILVMIAIEKDVVYLLDYYIKRNKYDVRDEIFEMAISYKSMEITKYLYDNYNLKTVENLIKISDREFVQKRIGSMNLNKHQMSQGIIDAVKAKDLMVVNSLINIVDQNSLNLALENVDFEESLDIAEALLDAGAKFVVSQPGIEVYVELNSVTSAVKYLLSKVNEREDK